MDRSFHRDRPPAIGRCEGEADPKQVAINLVLKRAEADRAAALARL